MTTQNSRIIITALATAAFLAGCQSNKAVAPEVAIAPTPKPEPTVEKPAPAPVVAGIDGTWVPTDDATKGAYVAIFKQGRFLSKGTNGGPILAKGSYSGLTNESVSLKFVGAASGTNQSAQCERRTPTQLYCVQPSGSAFNLRKA